MIPDTHLIVWHIRTSRELELYCTCRKWVRHSAVKTQDYFCHIWKVRDRNIQCEGKMARYKSKEETIQPPQRSVTKGFPWAVGFSPDKSLCVKQGDRLVLIVLPWEGADSGVKGAIKVEWLRKGDLLEQMKRAWIKNAIGLNRMKWQHQVWK